MRGHRRIIAYVGAALVRWEPVPGDLSICQPSLEDALLGLLNGDQLNDDQRDQSATASVHSDLIGGRR